MKPLPDEKFSASYMSSEVKFRRREKALSAIGRLS
jgi:hypothetical protein